MSETTQRCDFCGGELVSGTTTLELWRGEELVVIRDVPADVLPAMSRSIYIGSNLITIR